MTNPPEELSTSPSGRCRFLGFALTVTTLVAAGAAVGVPPASAAACGDGAFNAQAVLTGSTWSSHNGGRAVYTGPDMRAAVQAALNSLTARRTTKQSVVVRGSGTVSAAARIILSSYTVLDVCGTITVTGAGSGDSAPVYARGSREIEVRHLTLRGTLTYGIFMRNVDELDLGEIDMRVSRGLGIRIDNHGGDRAIKSRNIRIGNVYVSGTTDHAVETYGVDGLTIGTVTTRDVRNSGLLLNDTVNATVGTVDAANTATGTGYAAFRMANRNGRIGSEYPANIRVGLVKARGGGRGIFCVSESGGAVIDRLDIADAGGHSVLIENCHNVTLAAVSGTVSGGGEVRVSARSNLPPSSNVRLQNLTVSNTTIRRSPCTGVGNTVTNLTRTNAPLHWC